MLTDQDASGWRDALQARRSVDEVACDHALVRGAESDRGLSTQDSRARLKVRAQGLDCLEKIDSRANGALRVVLVRDRRPQTAITASPMNFSTVPPYRVIVSRGDLEVARKRVADLFRVAFLGKRREADKVCEKDGDEPTLGHRCGLDRGFNRRVRPSRAGRRRGTAQCGAATRAKPRSGRIDIPAVQTTRT